MTNIEIGRRAGRESPGANLRLEPMRSGSTRRPSKVRRRPISFSRRNEKAPTWGGPAPRPRWREALDFTLFAVPYLALWAALVHYSAGMVR